MAQRTVSEQLADTRPRLRERARALGLAVLFLAVAGVVLWGMAKVAQHPGMPPECTVAYRAARTAADTVRIDRLVYPKKTTLSCGAAREAVRRRA